MPKGGGWRKPKGRSPRRRTPKPIILIVCEGEKTEPNYFHGIRKSKRISKDRMDIFGSADGPGTDPLGIVKFAKIKRDEMKTKGLPYNEIWCVFDRDQHLTFSNAIQMADKIKIKVAYSIPCFELWVLLHFRYQTGHIERDECLREVKSPSCLPDYEKGDETIYDNLLPHREMAIKNAERLIKYHEDNFRSKFANPKTKVHLLVEYLLDLKG